MTSVVPECEWCRPGRQQSHLSYLSEKLPKVKARTHRLEGELGFLQVVLALDLQHLGPLVDGAEVGGTAESIRGASEQEGG